MLFRVNIIHAHRMTVDCKHMRKKISELKQKAIEKGKIRFGQEVNLKGLDRQELDIVFTTGVTVDELEEAEMKKLIFSLRMNNENLQSLYGSEVKSLEQKYDSKKEELVEIVKSSTSRVDLLAVLNREKTELARLVAQQNLKRQQIQYTNASEVADLFREDILKLSKIVLRQNAEIKVLVSFNSKMKLYKLMLL